MKFLSAHLASSRVFPHYFLDYRSLTSKFCAKSMRGSCCINLQVWNKKNSLIHLGKIFFDLISLLLTVRKNIFFLFNYSLYVLTADSDVISLWCFLLKYVTSNQKVSLKIWKSSTSKICCLICH